MARARRTWMGIIFGVVVTTLLAIRSGYFAKEPERWFVPGPLGHERGHAVPPPSSRAFLTRAMTGVERTDGGEWARGNGLTASLKFSHALASVFPPALYATHPEFFPLVDGKRLQPPKTGSAFWNPDLGREDVAKHAADAARKFFGAHPAEESFALGVNDALVWGESPENLALVAPPKWFRERPDYSPLVFTFMNRVATEVAKTHPQKLLGALAYYWAENVPPFPVQPNVVPFLTADRAQGYDENFRAEEFQLQERWAKSGATRLGMYDYLYGNGFLIPRIHTRLLAENLRHARAIGFTDYYAEINPNWGLDGPMPWLAAQLLQDPEQPRERLLDEYYRRYFGEAAGPMREFFDGCERQWMAQTGPTYWLKHFRNESQAAVFPAEVCVQLRRSLDAAAQRANSESVRARVQLVSDAFGVTERFVAFAAARDRLARTVLKRGQRWRATAADLHEYFTRRRDFIHYTEALRRDAPLALAPFGWDDYLKDDPASAALCSIHEDSLRKGEATAAESELSRWNEPAVGILWPALRAATQETRLERNGNLSGALVTARRSAGLEYSLSLPAEWTSQTEPSQFFREDLSESESGRALRVAGTKDARIFQWNGVTRRGLNRGSVVLRGHVSPGASVSVMIGWLDARERSIGFKAFRLPEGEWNESVTLDVAALTPESATWVGVGMRIQNQVAGDWVEAKDFRLSVQ